MAFSPLLLYLIFPLIFFMIQWNEWKENFQPTDIYVLFSISSFPVSIVCKYLNPSCFSGKKVVAFVSLFSIRKYIRGFHFRWQSLNKDCVPCMVVTLVSDAWEVQLSFDQWEGMLQTWEGRGKLINNIFLPPFHPLPSLV